MHAKRTLSLIPLFLIVFFLSGCRRSSEDIWDDTKTCGRHMSKGLRSLGGKHGESRQVCHREDFFRYDDPYKSYDYEEFEPLPDDEWPKDMSLSEGKKPKETEFFQSQAGLRDSKKRIPGIERFQDPKESEELGKIFKNLSFPYNSSLVKGKNNLRTVQGVVDFLKSHPKTFVFIAGHCDERGPEAYNLTLGTRRSNAVRDFLIKEGISPEHLFTVSYGKERPLELGHTEDAWSKNRRAEFKIYTNRD
ncbi:MAG: OmpA family protein [Waddliaceae bacterium]